MFKFIKSKILYIVGILTFISPVVIIPILKSYATGVGFVFAILGSLLVAAPLGAISVIAQMYINSNREEERKKEFEIKKAKELEKLKSSKVIKLEKIKKFHETYKTNLITETQNSKNNNVKHKIISFVTKKPIENEDSKQDNCEENKVDDLTK